MNKFRMAKAGINVNEAVERLCGDIDSYENLLADYLNCSYYKEMLQHLEERNVEAAFQSAHALKGVAANLSLKKLYDALNPVVESLRAGDIEVSGFLAELDEANEKVLNAIKDMVDKQNA